MKKHTAIAGIFIIGISIFGMFQVKYKVINLKRDLSEINRQLAADKDSIRVLKAEWAYLNKPERIMKLSSKYLKINNLLISQIYRNNQVDNIYLASLGNIQTAHRDMTRPTLNPILSSARGYR